MKENNKEKDGTGWLGRSLSNYKDMHRSTAENKGVLKEFLNAKTLTEARKVAFGLKRKSNG